MKIRSTYTIEEEVVKALRGASKVTRRSMSDIVEQALEEWLYRLHPAHDEKERGKQ